METITMPVKEYTEMRTPYADTIGPSKIRFYVRLDDVPKTLANWMSTNPREQNLKSPVAQAIAASIQGGKKDFHLKNRGILLSAKAAVFTPSEKEGADGKVTLTLEEEHLHGNVDGGHTLKLILDAQSKADLPEQYVEFEVIIGLDDLLPVAEARNTSVALDIRTMEEMKGSFEVLKSVFGEVEIDGSQFFDRVELKMNQQLEEANHIDVRNLISIILMFNQDVYPIPSNRVPELNNVPIRMYGNPEAALKKYLALGGGDPEKRSKIIGKMTPILRDIILLWDTIEREFPLVNEKKYARLPFAQRLKAPKAMFSDQLMKYTVPTSVLYPVVAGFRVLVDVDKSGAYSWAASPLKLWEETKEALFSSFMNSMKTAKNNPAATVKRAAYWTMYNQIVLLRFLGVG